MAFVDRKGFTLDDRSESEFFAKEVVAWVGARPLRWRAVWLLTLHEKTGWSFGRIAALSGLDRSYVCRVIRQTRRELQALVNPEVAS